MKATKKLLALVLCAIMVLSLAACGNQSTTQPTTPSTPATTTPSTPSPSTTEPATTPEPAGTTVDKNLPVKIDMYDFVSGNNGGSWQQVAVAIADRANDSFFDGFPITALPGGGAANPVTLDNGDAEIGMAGGPFLVRAQSGLEPYDHAITGMSAIASLLPIAVFFVVQDSYPVQTFGELVENLGQASIGTSPAGNTTYYDLRNTFAAYGVNDVDAAISSAKGNIIYGDASTLNSNWTDGHINCYVYCTTNPSSAITEAMTTRESHLLSLSEDAVKILCEQYGYIRYVVAAGTYPGQDQDILTVAEPTILFCRDDVPNEVSYYLAEAIYENKDFIAAASAAYKQLDVTTIGKDTILPLHPGAQLFYEENGLL